MKGIQLAGSLLLLTGILLLLTLNHKVSSVMAIVLIIAGVLCIIVYNLVIRKETNLLCRIGLHKYNHVGWDEEIKSRSIYRCERCQKEKKVMRAI
ncbi:hypothetical protein [Halobacillus mangrovi]|uniref:Uncharacterized protein n=1 Tax=Halobacillus mangrovi TaxID=402384 RepID=A0A1W5ZWU6_9BACI|nr:hypothetical protein [Halobacillus mangrovi]ARI77782.1 hypothetical protein HM131_13400 [Halobacillus mangrovi]